MPKYRYIGTGPCRYGNLPVNTGDIVDASAQPGKNFVLIEDGVKKEEPPPPAPRRRSSADTNE